ncbi:MAG: GNAT family N-acetyltransferase, partial [Bacteroidota bacterium]
MDNYSFERLNKYNLKHLVTLYKNAFNIDIDEEDLKKKYNTKLFGLDYVGFLAISKDNIPAAYYGVFPILCSCNKIKVLCAQSGDTMTHKDHRGKGLFIELAKRTYELAKNNGVHFIFGFPNDSSYPGFVRKLDWKHVDDINMYSIKVSTIPLAKIVKKTLFLTPIYSLFVKFIFLFYEKSHKGFENSLSADGYDSILHDDSFFSYKSYHPSYFLKIKKKIVWLKIDGRLWIGDIEISSWEEFNSIIKSLKILACMVGANEIHFHTSPNTKYNNYMSKSAVTFNGGDLGGLV